VLHGSNYQEELTSKIECQVVAPDLRGHGESENADADDLSAERQVGDICNLYESLFGGSEKKPPMILVGHSMGGALAIHTANARRLPNLQAIAVIGVVEGSAMAALTFMAGFLRGRPKQFESEERAIRWCMESGQARNLRAARVSMPSQIRSTDEAGGKKVFKWRINLSKSEPHWVGWFKGTSKLFLSVDPVKILILANVDRLDKELLTGQMRGMFQTEILPKTGHAVQEDSPESVAAIFVALVRRYKVIFDKATK